VTRGSDCQGRRFSIGRVQLKWGENSAANGKFMRASGGFKQDSERRGLCGWGKINLRHRESFLWHSESFPDEIPRNTAS
jgi:hypothetical protein